MRISSLFCTPSHENLAKNSSSSHFPQSCFMYASEKLTSLLTCIKKLIRVSRKFFSDLLFFGSDKKQKDSGHSIFFEFKQGDRSYGVERVERINIKEPLLISLEKRKCLWEQWKPPFPLYVLIIHLYRRLKGFPSLSLENQEAEEEKKRESPFMLQVINSFQLAADSLPELWIRSSFFRDQLKKINEKKYTLDTLNDYIKEIEAICVAAPVNFRYHFLEIGGKRRGFFRLGAMTDPRNGFTHLKELEEMQHNEELREAKKRELEVKRSAISSSSDPRALMLSYAIWQIKDSLELQETIRKRKEALTQQMLQLIEQQASKDSSEETIFPLIHVSLLNPKINDFGVSGWCHNEAHQLMDMDILFKSFSGRKLIFDGQGPLLDIEGNIHLAEKRKDKSGNILQKTLEPILFNISVQGHEKNDGIQQEINKEALQKLEEILPSWTSSLTGKAQEEAQIAKTMLNGIKDNLDKGVSNYYLAEELTTTFALLYFAFSLGCLSAKDRTGFVAARTIFRLFVHELENDSQLKEQPNLINQLKESYKDVLAKEGCAAQVVYDNTGILILKCSALILPGYEGARGMADRLAYAYKQAKQLRSRR